MKDETFNDDYKEQQRKVATGVTGPEDSRNGVLEEVAVELAKLRR